MKTVPASLQTHLNGTVTTLAWLWEVRRVDDQRFYFTNHDRDITFSGNVYESAFGFNQTALSNRVGLAPDEVTILGVFDSAAITDDDLRGGKFDHAEIFVSQVNYKNPGQGATKLLRGKLGEVVYSEISGQFEVELKTLTQLYAQELLEHTTPTCRADLGDARCKVPIDPPYWTGDTVQVVDDHVKFPVDDTVTEISLTNGDFETDSVGATTITGWTTLEGTPVIASSNGSIASAKEGSKFVEGNGGAGGSATRIEQVVDLTGTYSDADLDSGHLLAYVQLWRSASFADDTTQALIRFLRSDDSEISQIAGTAAHFLGTWDDDQVGALEGSTSGILPSGTRKIAIQLVFDLVTGSFPNGAADDVHLFIRDRTATAGVGQFSNVIYKCTQGGTTDSHFPPFVNTLSATVAEAGRRSEVQWQVVDAWTRQAVVATVTDNRVFTITVTEARAVDDWFRYGTVFWDSGNNVGLAMEVKGWTQSTSEVQLFLAMPFAVQVGDRLRIHVGCDKEEKTCFERFANVINMRAEPYLPGQDEFHNYPDVRR